MPAFQKSRIFRAKTKIMTMKRIFAFALVLSLALPLSAQDLMDKLADSACACISKKDVEKMGSEELQMQLGFCIMEAVGNNAEAFQKEYGGLDPTDTEAMTKLGEQIGMKMAFRCPTVMMKVATVTTEVVSAPAPAVTEELTGTVKAIEGDEIAQIVVVDEAGRTHKLLWLRYFKGDSRFISEPGKVAGSKVRVKFETIDAYSPKAREYFGRKEIREVEFLK